MFESGSAATSGDPASVFLARHGETTWNVERRFQGHGDSPLSPRGHEQARRLGERLAGESIVAVYSSDLGRSVATAEYVAGPHGLTVQTHPGFREIDVGIWTGLRRDDTRAVPTWAQIMTTYRQRPWVARMPEGESVREVQARALAAIREIAARHRGKTIAVIAHHVVVETIVVEALGMSIEQLWLPHKAGNCFLSLLEVWPDRMTAPIVYDGCHVDDLGWLQGTKGEPEAPADDKATA